jgi:predicted XRE-type DNA-binding protein
MRVVNYSEARNSFKSVWDAIEATPLEAATMRAKSKLLMALQHWLVQTTSTQKAAATHLGITQLRLSDLKRGHIDLFSPDTLLNMAEQAGLAPTINVRALPNAKPAITPLTCPKGATHLAKAIALNKAGKAMPGQQFVEIVTL